MNPGFSHPTICCVGPGLVPTADTSDLLCTAPCWPYDILRVLYQQFPFKFVPLGERCLEEWLTLCYKPACTRRSLSSLYQLSVGRSWDIPDPAVGCSSWLLPEPLLLLAPKTSSCFLLLLISGLPHDSMLDFQLNQLFFSLNRSII